MQMKITPRSHTNQCCWWWRTGRCVLLVGTSVVQELWRLCGGTWQSLEWNYSSHITAHIWRNLEPWSTYVKMVRTVLAWWLSRRRYLLWRPLMWVLSWGDPHGRRKGLVPVGGPLIHAHTQVHVGIISFVLRVIFQPRMNCFIHGYYISRMGS